MRAGTKTAMLLDLKPGATLAQHSTMILMRGSLTSQQVRTQRASGKASTAPAAVPAAPAAGGNGVTTIIAPVQVFHPPALLMWLPHFFEYGISRYFKRGSSMQRYTAGESGACVLVSDVEFGKVVGEESGQ